MDKITKKRVKRYITWACMAGVVLLLTVMPLLAKNEAEKDGPQASILSAVAENGSITTALHSGGTLEDEDAQDANIPTGVKITGFLVKNGDIVKAGDPVATVDKTSVMEAVTSVNETMDFLREELEDGRDEKVDSTITAVPGGRVKKIFAREGESVQEVMLRDGALAVLSIDSMMAVQFDTVSALGTGENVDVTFKDGTTVTGRVESNLDGMVVVTVDDEGYEVGQSVTVEDLGTGTLYIHNAWKATGYAGTISRVHAKEEQTLNAGGNLFTLEDREFEGQLQYRANQHREYETLLQELLKMYNSGTIDAPCEGIVSGVDEDSIHLLAADGEWEIQLLDNSTPKYQIVFLSNQTNCTCGQELHTPACPEACSLAVKEGECAYTGTGSHKDGCIEACNPSNCTATGAHKAGCITFCKETEKPEDCPNPANGNHKEKCIHKCSGNATEKNDCPGKGYHYTTCIESCQSCEEGKDCPATRTHKTDCIERCTHASITTACDAEKHYKDCILRCGNAKTANDLCDATKHLSTCYYYGVTYTATAAKVFDKGTNELIVFQDPSGTIYPVEKTASGWKVVGGAVNTNLLVQGGTISASNAGSFQKDDIILVITGARPDGTKVGPYIVLYSRTSSKQDNSDLMTGMMGNMSLSGMMGGFSGFGNYGGMTMAETENLHDIDGSPLLTVTPHKTMKLAITLDEQDISKIEIGMPATLKVEALKNQVFSGEVTEIGIHGTNNGGSSKYSATITLQAAEDMLPGMSASASIPLETRENVLTIPVAALYDVDGKTVVYTAVDRDNGELSGAVEVVTGVSDGEKVEILSGLSQGDTVYYSYYDTLEEDTSAKAEKFTFG